MGTTPSDATFASMVPIAPSGLTYSRDAGV
jgi:hypothetical protein